MVITICAMSSQTVTLAAIYLAISAIALRFSVSRRTVRRWIAQGLPFFQERPRCKVLIRPDDVEAFLQRRHKGPVVLNELVEETAAELMHRHRRQRKKATDSS